MLYNTKNPHGGDIYDREITLDFSANTNPFGTPEGVLRAITDSLDSLHRYPDAYCRALVKAIAEHEKVAERYVLCGNGAAELIYSFCRAVKPKIAIETAPTFSEYSLALEASDGEMRRYLLKRENGFALDEGFLEFAEKTDAKAVFLCNPNNPTGQSISPILLKNLLKLCEKKGAYLFLDECFLDLAENIVSMKSFLREYSQLVILKAFTKSYGMAGVRLGYCLCSDEKLLCEMAKTVQPWNVSSVAQAAGTAALKENEFLQRTRELIAKERPRVKSKLESLGLWVCDSTANYLLFSGRSDLAEKLEKRGILIRNCENYHGLSSGWFRIAIKLPNQNDMLINAIKEIMERK